MARWTIEELKNIDDISFAVRILNERRQTTTNVYSPLNQKISKAINTLENIRAEQIKQSNK